MPYCFSLRTGLLTGVLPGLVLATALQGCSATDTVDDRSADAAGAQLPVLPDAWAGEISPGGEPIGWVEAFDDPALAALVEEAQANNRDLQAAAAGVEQALALARQAGAALSPAVSLSGGGDRSGTADAGGSTGLSVGVQASWELDVWGRIRSGQAAAAESAAAAAADFTYARRSLAAAVTRSYLLAIEARMQEQVARGILDGITETQRIVEVRFENGMSDAQDIALTRTDLANARDTLVAAQGAKRDAARALELLLGRYPGAEINVQTALPVLPGPPPAGLPSEILEGRPDLVAAERRVASAFNRVDAAKAARLPQLSLTASAGSASAGLSNLLSPDNVAWSAGANLLAPVLDGGARKAQVEIDTAAQKQALAAYGQAALAAFGEVENALDQGVVLRRRRAALAEASRESEEALRLTRLRYDEGESDLLDVLTIQQRVFAAQSTLLSVERQQLDQRVDLSLALGDDW